MYKLLLFLFASNCIAQNPINIIITGNCSPVNSVYNYTGLINGKNNYSAIITSGGNPATVSVTYDGVKWVLHNGVITDTGFINTTVPSGLLPPLTGWQVVNCGNGTMIISDNLSKQQFEENKFKITPNPASNYISIDYLKNLIFDYNIFDLLGRTIISGNSNYSEKIIIDALKTGNYIIQIKDEFGNLFQQKFIKN